MFSWSLVTSSPKSYATIFFGCQLVDKWHTQLQCLKISSITQHSVNKYLTLTSCISLVRQNMHPLSFEQMEFGILTMETADIPDQCVLSSEVCEESRNLIGICWLTGAHNEGASQWRSSLDTKLESSSYSPSPEYTTLQGHRKKNRRKEAIS